MKQVLGSLLVVLCLSAIPCMAALPTIAPNNLQITQPNPLTTAVSWDSVPSATSYLVRVESSGLPTRTLKSIATTITLRGLPAGSQQTFYVRSRNNEGEGPDASSLATIAPPTTTTPPANITITNVGSTAAIRWSTVSNAVSYSVQLQNLTTGTPSNPITTRLPLAAFVGLTVDHQYVATIEAVDGNGGKTSVTASFVAAALTAPSSALTGLTVTPQTMTSALAAWNAVPTASAYQLYIGANPSTLTAQRPLFVSGLSRTITGLTSGTTYYLAIRSLNQAGFGALSPPLSFLSLIPPAAPSVTVTPGILSATATWPVVSTANAYTLYLNGGTFNKPTASVLAHVTSPMILNNLTGGQLYSLGLSASNPAGEGPLSPVQAVTPNPLLPPVNLATGGGPSAIEAMWDAAAGATSYEIGYNVGSTFAGGSATVVPATANPFTIASLINGQVYSLATRSILGTTRSAWTSAVQETPRPTTSILYRDARNFGGVLTKDCTYQGWYVWVYHPCSGDFSTATAITGNAYHGATGASTIPLRVNTGTYNLWVLGFAQSPRPIRAQHDTTVLTSTFTNSAVAWVNLGPLTINPTLPLILDMPANGNTDNVGVNVIGIYLTQGQETPTALTNGNTGDISQNLATPHNVVASPGYGTITIRWTPDGHETGVNLYYLSGTGTFSKTSATMLPLPAGTTSYAFSGLPTGATIQAALSATFDNGESVLGAVQSATTIPVPQPMNVTASAGDKQVTINWSAVSSVTSYTVAYNLGSTFDPANATKISGLTSLSKTITGLTNTQTYTFSVQAVSGSLTGNWGIPVTAMPLSDATGFYRDARDFFTPQSAGNPSSCSGSWWTIVNKWMYECAATSYSSADRIFTNTFTIPTANRDLPTMISTQLVTGIYHVYLYGQSDGGLRYIQVCNGAIGTTNCSSNTPILPGSFAWVDMGTISFDPTKPIILRSQQQGSSQYVGVHAKGVFLTAGATAPTAAPTGMFGDQAFINGGAAIR